jgi:alkylated DNA repair dioxygenase AlkB
MSQRNLDSFFKNQPAAANHQPRPNNTEDNDDDDRPPYNVTPKRDIVLDDGGLLTYFPRFYAPARARAMFDSLRADLPWEQFSVIVFGKSHPQPRLCALVADEECIYRYSGLTLVPHPWSTCPTLALIRDNLQQVLGVRFNSVLCNFYRANGSDYMGMHSDDEAVFGPQPTIASVTFGYARTFVVQHKVASRQKTSTNSWSCDLASGSLLVMKGRTQEEYRHGVPKRAKAGERINLTFRLLFPELASSNR